MQRAHAARLSHAGRVQPLQSLQAGPIVPVRSTVFCASRSRPLPPSSDRPAQKRRAAFCGRAASSSQQLACGGARSARAKDPARVQVRSAGALRHFLLFANTPKPMPKPCSCAMPRQQQQPGVRRRCRRQSCRSIPSASISCHAAAELHPTAATMKVKTINRSEEAYTRERAQDVQKVRAGSSALGT